MDLLKAIAGGIIAVPFIILLSVLPYIGIAAAVYLGVTYALGA